MAATSRARPMTDRQSGRLGVILLADEPTGSLDSRSGTQVMELFRRLNEEGVSILMITHDPGIAAHADRIVEIRDGRIKGQEGIA